MGHIIADLKETFRRGNIFIQLIYINVGIFLIGTLINVFLRLFEVSTPDIFGIFALPASFIGFIHQPWSLFTYMFMHAGILHILFNMLWLYWFGSLFLYFFSAKHLRGLYVLGGICGGLLYMVAYNVFPLFSSQVAGATLVGASASVLAFFFSVLSVSNIWHWLLSESMYYPSPQVMPEDISPTWAVLLQDFGLPPA